MRLCIELPPQLEPIAFHRKANFHAAKVRDGAEPHEEERPEVGIEVCSADAEHGSMLQHLAGGVIRDALCVVQYIPPVPPVLCTVITHAASPTPILPFLAVELEEALGLFAINWPWRSHATRVPGPLVVPVWVPVWDVPGSKLRC